MVSGHHQRSSEVIRGHQRLSSEVIRGHWRSSEAIIRVHNLINKCVTVGAYPQSHLHIEIHACKHAHQRQIRGHQWPSEVISGHHLLEECMQTRHRTSEAVRLYGGDNGHACLELRARDGARLEERPLAFCGIDCRARCGLNRRRYRRLASRACLWGTEGRRSEHLHVGLAATCEPCVPQAPRASPSPWIPRRAVGNGCGGG